METYREGSATPLAGEGSYGQGKTPLSILGYRSGNGCERVRVPDGMGSPLALCEQHIAANRRLASRIIGIMLAVCHKHGML